MLEEQSKRSRSKLGTDVAQRVHDRVRRCNCYGCCCCCCCCCKAAAKSMMINARSSKTRSIVKGRRAYSPNDR